MRYFLVIFSMLVALNAQNYTIQIIKKTPKTQKKSVDLSRFVSKNLTRKSNTVVSETNCTKLLIPHDAQTVRITSKVFGPLPVTLHIYDTNKSVIQSQTNNTNLVTDFSISVATLPSNSVLKITNAFDDVLVCKQLIKE